MHAQQRDAEIGPLVEAAAERRYKTATLTGEEQAEHCMTFGGLYEVSEQYSAAERWYRRLLEAKPDRFEPLAIVLAKQKRGREAVRVCLDAAKRGGASRSAMAVCTMRATGQIDEQDFHTADSLVVATEKDKPEPQFLAMLAAVRVLQGRTDEALSLYRDTLAAKPQDIRTMNNLATLLGEQSAHVKESLDFIDRAIRLAGPQGWLLETKGQILLHDGRVDEALAMLKEAATLDETDPRVLLHLAQAYRLAGRVDQARRAFADARKRNLPQQLLTPADRKLIAELDETFRGQENIER